MADTKKPMKGKRPTARLFMSVANADGELKDREMGAAWQHQSGKGHSIALRGKIVELDGVLKLAHDYEDANGNKNTLWTDIAELVEEGDRVRVEWLGSIYIDDVTAEPADDTAH